MLRLLFISIFFFPSFVLAQDVQVSDVDDLSFGTWTGGGQSLSDGLCIYKSSGNDRYFVTVTGSGSGGSFELSASGGTIGFTVKWGEGGGTPKKVNAGAAKRYSGANTSSTNCGGSTNATLQVDFANNELSSAVPGNYSGSLTILIEPA